MERIVLTDEKWLEFVIEQVLSNAIKYTAGGTISVYLEEYKRVFTPYFRYIENDYLDSFALKQDVGYYVFALREIIV